jgi:hypothetical protein
MLVPGGVIARLQIILDGRLRAVIGEPVDRWIVPRSVAQAQNVPDSIGEGDILPFGEIAIDHGSLFQSRNVDGVVIRVLFLARRQGQ